AHVDVHGPGHHNTVQDWFEQLGDQRLEWVALDWEADADHGRQHAGMTGGAESDLPRRDPAAAGADTDHPVPLKVEPGDLAALDSVVGVVFETFPEFELVLVHSGAVVPQVVGAVDGGVSGHVASGQPASLEYGAVA